MRCGWLLLLFFNFRSSCSESNESFFGLRAEHEDYFKNDFILYKEDAESKFMFFAENADQVTNLSFVTLSEYCDANSTNKIEANFISRNTTRFVASAKLRPFEVPYKACLTFLLDEQPFVISADEFRVYQYNYSQLYMNYYLQFTLIGCLLLLSGYFSGINISIFSLSIYHLRLLSSCSEPKMAAYAKNILPLRKQANLLLSTLVLGNVAVNNVLTLLIDNTIEYYVDADSKYIFSIPVTLCLIMTFGEIIPQAIGIKYCLQVVSGTRHITIFFFVLFFPVAWPISKVLDLLVGETGRNIYNCEELKTLVQYHHDRQQDQSVSMKLLELVVGAYKLPENKIKDVMTPMDKVYMLDENTLMTDAVCREIHQRGHTRVPLYSGSRNMITSILNVKDLAAFLPNCKIRLGFFAKMFHRNLQIRFVLDEMNLMKLLRLMKRGHPMVFVLQFNSDLKDYEIAGLITVEDIIEEVIGEINDEKDARRKSQQHKVKIDKTSSTTNVKVPVAKPSAVFDKDFKE
ncbi:unnamed protein product [Bursaphelenchus okinawaensis]|uniref:CNNM transmembrane domain-containing protein n=1 Tax=Bursaphelenchus okinawaensis TaxID=465554 RepID=A0A811LL67_9BILA|nr:unnamed protein product [Bursaphelenchus okinawaensis]CAG9124440.1 unnamed protein product [Bursaphelenchus okinawaensis]